MLNEDKYKPVIPYLDIDGIISPRELTVSRVLRYIRKGKVSNVYELIDGAAEIIEFVVRDGSRLIGVTLKEAKLPEKSHIGALVRDDLVITPTGDTVVEKGDKVVICLLHEEIRKVEEFLFEDTELI